MQVQSPSYQVTVSPCQSLGSPKRDKAAVEVRTQGLGNISSLRKQGVILSAILSTVFLTAVVWGYGENVHYFYILKSFILFFVV